VETQPKEGGVAVILEITIIVSAIAVIGVIIATSAGIVKDAFFSKEDVAAA
jgi:hypothetical protein